MTNILIITGWLDVSGTETFIMNVLRNIDKSLYHIDFLLFQKKESRYSIEAESLGCRLFYLPSRKKGFFNYLRALNIFFKNNSYKYDVVHYCGGSLTSVAPIFFSKKYGINKRIIHAHSTSTDGIHNKILHNINKCFAQSLFTHRWGCSKEACKFFFGRRESKIIKNGIDINRFVYNEHTRTNIKSILGINPEYTVIGHIGRFVKLKNQSFVVDIFKEYQKLNPNSTLLLVGIGPEMEMVRSKVCKYNLTQNVIFTGERHDVPMLLHAMDYFVMPSLYEGLPFVLVEAQAAGTFCVVSDTISPDSKISDILSFMSLNDNAEKWAEYINNTRLDYNRENCSKIVRDRGYDINSTTRYIESVYSGEIK